jgi:spore germination cell wall hydrolase CwlJ-like protein
MRKSKIFGNFIRQIGADSVIYYHRTDIKPRWAYYKGDVIDIGKHVFYKDG